MVQYLLMTESRYLFFNPSQIKSATDNVGTFDAGNEDIRFRMAQEAEAATDSLEEESLNKDRNRTIFTDNNGNNKGRNSILQEDAVQIRCPGTSRSETYQPSVPQPSLLTPILPKYNNRPVIIRLSIMDSPL